MCQRAGPIIDLLLEHVAQVQLCSKLTELLDSQEEWLAVKRKSRKHQTKSYQSLAPLTCKRVTFTSSHMHTIQKCLFSFVSSVTSSTAAPLQITDSDPNGEKQTEISHEPTPARQTDQIPEPG